MIAVVCQIVVSLMLACQTSCLPSCVQSVNEPSPNVATAFRCAFLAQADDEPSPFDPGDLPPLMSGAILDDGERQHRESRKENPRRRHTTAWRNDKSGFFGSVRERRYGTSVNLAKPSHACVFPLRI